jgi:hypothetical protein
VGRRQGTASAHAICPSNGRKAHPPVGISTHPLGWGHPSRVEFHALRGQRRFSLLAIGAAHSWMCSLRQASAACRSNSLAGHGDVEPVLGADEVVVVVVADVDLHPLDLAGELVADGPVVG